MTGDKKKVSELVVMGRIERELNRLGDVDAQRRALAWLDQRFRRSLYAQNLMLGDAVPAETGNFG